MTTQTQARPVASRATANAGSAERVDFHYHPRLIRALGAELVTSDIVAIIELVKNSYDAFAHNVTIRFAEDAQGEYIEYIEVLDDGLGMTRDVIEDAWLTVATPHKVSHRLAQLGARQRRVSGDKGLGRLSSARLGNRLEMITQAHIGPCWKVDVQWDVTSRSDGSGGPFATVTKTERDSYFRHHGTRIRIYDTIVHWSDQSFTELEDSLARLVSPFKSNDEFTIKLQKDSSSVPNTVQIESPEFLANPPYKVIGRVDMSGNVKAKYVHSNFGTIVRHVNIDIDWTQIYDNPRNPVNLQRSSPHGSACGPFEFEIRAWDLNADERQAIADHFIMKKSDIQRAVNANKGITLYRDGVLVLPKTEQGKDWLDLDSRRVKRVGPRIGTRNVIGYVSIGAATNPDIVDTSDREALAKNIATDEFRCILMAAVSRFETERNSDRIPQKRDLKDVFSAVTARPALTRAQELEGEDAPISAIVQVIERHAEQLDRTRGELRERFVYYSRVAALGQMAHMLVHEVRNRTTSIGAFLRRISATLARTDGRSVRLFELANGSVQALEALADKLAPLASRSFRRSRSSVVEHQMRDCVEMLSDTLRASRVRCEVPISETLVAVDPAELTHVFYNLIDNSAYWLGLSKINDRKIALKISTHRDPEKVTISVEDNGPGIDDDNEERIFWPGFTMKPHGTGMGLTIASELVAVWGGDMALQRDGDRDGACFIFDAPLDLGELKRGSK